MLVGVSNQMCNQYTKCVAYKFRESHIIRDFHYKVNMTNSMYTPLINKYTNI